MRIVSIPIEANTASKLLVNATKLYWNHEIDFETYEKLLEQRTVYELRPKEQPEPGKPIVLCCPASGPCPTVICDGKPTSLDIRHVGKTRIPVMPDHPDRICTNRSSVTFPFEAGAKYRQELPYKSALQQSVYAMLRNCVEGKNAYTKDGAYEQLEDGARRRAREIAAQSVIVSLLVAVANIRAIRKFLSEGHFDKEGRLVKFSVRAMTPEREERYQRASIQIDARAHLALTLRT